MRKIYVVTKTHHAIKCMPRESYVGFELSKDGFRYSPAKYKWKHDKSVLA
jgi:hypothetical protein